MDQENEAFKPSEKPYAFQRIGSPSKKGDKKFLA